MFRRLLDLVCCPQCGSRLSATVFSERQGPPAEIDEGFLTCVGCSAKYPIIAGVPRLIRNAPEEYRAFYAAHADTSEKKAGSDTNQGQADPEKFHKRSNESFSFQWQVYQYTDRTWFKDDLNLRRREFLTSLDLEESQLRGALLLDAGCGNGRLTASIASYGAEIVGMDLSRSVERAHANRSEVAGAHAHMVHFVQGNVMEPPFPPGTFDHVHTSGVLHHTPDTRRAFMSVQQLARSGGRVYVQLYRTRPAWVGIPNKIIRSITCRLPVPLVFWMCYATAPLHAFLVSCVSRLRREEPVLRHATRRERALSMFDNYSPRYQYRYQPHEVASMFTAAGLRNVRDVTLPNEMRHMVAFVGDK